MVIFWLKFREFSLNLKDFHWFKFRVIVTGFFSEKKIAYKTPVPWKHLLPYGVIMFYTKKVLLNAANKSNYFQQFSVVGKQRGILQCSFSYCNDPFPLHNPFLAGRLFGAFCCWICVYSFICLLKHGPLVLFMQAFGLSKSHAGNRQNSTIF